MKLKRIRLGLRIAHERKALAEAGLAILECRTRKRINANQKGFLNSPKLPEIQKEKKKKSKKKMCQKKEK